MDRWAARAIKMRLFRVDRCHRRPEHVQPFGAISLFDRRAHGGSSGGGDFSPLGRANHVRLDLGGEGGRPGAAEAAQCASASCVGAGPS
jgi:hypothetical protein